MISLCALYFGEMCRTTATTPSMTLMATVIYLFIIKCVLMYCRDGQSIRGWSIRWWEETCWYRLWNAKFAASLFSGRKLENIVDSILIHIHTPCLKKRPTFDLL